MNTFLRPLKRQDGFTLVELMVVVAIIGLLSAVAIPNFRKYQAKSKLSEAKLQLSAVYTAEAAFFSDFNIYGVCLRYMGFDPFPETANRYYGVGFSAGVVARNGVAHTAAVNAGLQEDECVGTAWTPVVAAAWANPASNNQGWFQAGRGMGAQIVNAPGIAALNAAGAVQATCTRLGLDGMNEFGTCIGTQTDIDTMVFQASAVGFISGDFTAEADASGLNINHNKQVKTAVNGF